MADPITMPIYGLLKAIAEGADTRPIRRQHGDYLIETVELTTGSKPDDRQVRLHRHHVTINLTPATRRRFAELHRKHHPNRPVPDLDPVTVHLERVVKMRVRWPRYGFPGQIVIDAPGVNDPWGWRGWFERPHRIPIRGRRQQRDAANLVSAIWYLRPDLLPADKVTEAVDRSQKKPPSWRLTLSRQVVMSQQTAGRQRRAAPVHPGQEMPAKVQQVTRRGWGGQEVRWRR